MISAVLFRSESKGSGFHANEHPLGILNIKQIIYKLQLHDAIYRLRFYSNLLIHILPLSNSHNNVVSIQKNRGDKSHSVIVAILSQNKKLNQKCFYHYIINLSCLIFIKV